MEIVESAQNTSVSTRDKVANYDTISELIDSVQFDLENQDIDFVEKSESMSIGSYLFDALGEGLKQNFLGADINIEFLALSLRVYLIQLSRFALSYQKNLAENKYPERETAYPLSQKTVNPAFN